MSRSETSSEAWRALSAVKLCCSEQRIMNAFVGRADTTLTRKQLVDAVGMELSAVCGRVDSLLTKKALCVRGTYLDPQTRKRQELIGLPVDEQVALC